MHATPMEIVLAMNVFATDGYLVRPHLVKSIGGNEAAIVRRTPLDIERVYMDAVKSGLNEVVNLDSGTAHALGALGLNISGKTGTAQTTSGEAHGWFVGFLTYNKERYTFGAFVENCGTSHYAVDVCVDILKQINEGKLLD